VTRSSPRAPTRVSTWRATWIVTRKELVATFRDKQTTLYTIIVPIALYPFLFWAILQGALFVQGRAEHTEVRLGVAATSDAHVPAGLPRALRHDASARASTASRPAPVGGSSSAESPTTNTTGGDAPARPSDDVTSTVTSEDDRLAVLHVTTRTEPLDDAGARAWLGESKDRVVPAHGGEGPPDAVLLLHGPREVGDAPDPGADLLYDSTASRSQIAKRRVAARLPAFADSLRAESAAAMGYEPSSLQPFLMEEGKDVAAEERGGGFFLSLILPMLLVIMTVIGAFYPAVDFTAGERERNTSETTALLPVPRRAVHQGKILAVCACAVLATSLNLLALGLSAEHLLHMLGEGRELKVVLPIGALLSIAPLALLFSFFVSAVLTGVAALARTFKEGQALLGPVQLVFIFPAMAGAIPGLELTPGLCFVPVVNVVLAFRSLLKGQSMPLEYTLTALSLLLFAVAAVWIALRVLSRESLVSSGKSMGLADLVSLLRSKGASR